MKTFTLVTLLVFVNFIQAIKAQTFTISSYNCENAFDTIHNEGKNDYEFLPEGERHWSRKRMFDKLNNIGKVILSIDSIKPVDIVCLCEVENDTVLTYLTTRTPLSRIGYKYIMTNSLDERGINVAILYSPLTFRLLDYESIRPNIATKTRDILHVSGKVFGKDTIDIFAVHLPSKRNGKESENNRITIARQISHHIDSLNYVRQKPNIVLLGDFNDGPGAKVIKKGFPNLDNLMKKEDRSYKYQGRWDCIDQIFVNGNLKKKLVSCGVASRQFLLEKDEKYSGMKPKRTFIGWKYNNGYSDHLPVYSVFLF